MPWKEGRGRLGNVNSKVSSIRATRAKSELLFQGAGDLWWELKYLTCWQRGPRHCGEQLSVCLCPGRRCYSQGGKMGHCLRRI